MLTTRFRLQSLSALRDIASAQSADDEQIFDGTIDAAAERREELVLASAELSLRVSSSRTDVLHDEVRLLLMTSH